MKSLRKISVVRVVLTVSLGCSARQTVSVGERAVRTHEAGVESAAVESTAEQSTECGAVRRGAVCLGEGIAQVGEDDGEGRFEQRPVRAVRLRAFAMGRDEVTGGEWRRCVAAGRCSAMGCDEEVSDAAPARCVSWQQAEEYCGFVGGRLPTEAEWERAAAGLLPGHRKFPWGESAGSENEDGGGVTMDVTPEGVRSLGGGVAEWTAGEADFYPPTPRRSVTDGGDAGDASMTDSGVFFTDGGLWLVDDSAGRPGSPWRSLRGGSRELPHARWTSALRRFRLAGDAPPWAGLRCVW